MKARKIIIGVLQGLMSVSFLMAGGMKLTMPYEQLASQQAWAAALSPGLVMTIGVLEIMGVIGMNLPYLLRRYKQLVPLAAGGLTLTMLGAIFTHISLGEGFAYPLVQMIIVGAVAFARKDLLSSDKIQLATS